MPLRTSKRSALDAIVTITFEDDPLAFSIALSKVDNSVGEILYFDPSKSKIM